MSKIDLLESNLNWIRFIKEAFSPLELGIKKAAKDLESCWGVSNDKRKKIELIAPLNGKDSDWNGTVQIFSVNNRISVDNRLNYVGSEERMKGLSIKLNDKKFEAIRKGLKGKDVYTVEGTCMNQLLFAANWSVSCTHDIESGNEVVGVWMGGK
ncbi:hypothetical protein GOBAR_AA23629 [Gossypium barbadense]|uniref:Uncharacterized protein n=1 Tax=Gossypium barbadense TaxID=3634 RepID=A0A2P5X149_GOSBA|nr:hypothetical protein GOBAR_AA23629 [Gossypium barbadense]